MRWLIIIALPLLLPGSSVGTGEINLILPPPVADEAPGITAVRAAIIAGQRAHAATLARELAAVADSRLWTSIARLLAGEAKTVIRLMRAQPVRTAPECKVLAFAYSEAQQWVLFRQIMEEAARLDPNDDIPHYLLGRYWDAQAEDPERAEVAFHEALKRNPKRGMAHYYLGFLLERQQRFDEAEHAYQASLASSSDDALAVLGLARLRHQSGQMQEALALARQAESAAPQQPEVIRLLTKLLNEAPSEALPYWRRLTTLAPNDASNWYGLLRTLLALGRKEEAASAQRQFRLVRRIYGNH